MASSNLPFETQLRFASMRQVAQDAIQARDCAALARLAFMAIDMAQSATGIGLLNVRSGCVTPAQVMSGSLCAEPEPQTSRAQPSSPETWPEW
jgi:hypothetical protein